MGTAAIRLFNRGFNRKSFRVVALAVLVLGVIAPPLRASRPAPTEPHHFLSNGSVNAADLYWCQTQIERVYYTHRIWPKENSSPKPAFEVMVPAGDIQAGVTKFTQNSNTLTNQDGLTITPEQLQAEIFRMVQTTNDPIILSELFDALEGSPTLVAECLARPNLVNHLILETPPAAPGSQVASHGSQIHASGGPPPAPVYILPVINTANCAVWNPTRSRAPDARSNQTGVWTGSELIIWGGTAQIGIYTQPINSGSRYNPAIDSWLPASENKAPSARAGHTAIWTGTEMIIWGGGYYGSNTGGRYNPETDSWAVTSIVNAPQARSSHTAIWTGREMIIWGGAASSPCTFGNACNDGGRYSPLSDTWIATSTGANVPSSRGSHTAIWTGTEMIVWGGSFDVNYYNTGGRYNPVTDSWTSTSVGAGVPIGRREQTAIWTGNKMIVWGGQNNSSCSTLYGAFCDTGGVYTPSTNSWVATSTGTNDPTARYGHSAIWTGTEMIVWGGLASDNTKLNTGGRYDPVGNSWLPTPSGSPVGRDLHSAVWTGSEMIVWGGQGISACAVPDSVFGFCNTGGRYNPTSNSWQPTYIGENVPTRRAGHTAVWTGAEMIVWGGPQDTALNGGIGATGSKYFPAINDWVKVCDGDTTCNANRPSPRKGHTAVWDGTQMLIWGGDLNDANDFVPPETDSGAKYYPGVWNLPGLWTQSITTTQNPVLPSTCCLNPPCSRGCPSNSNCSRDPTVPRTISEFPESRAFHTVVWTGDHMIVWGGGRTTSALEPYEIKSWGRYNDADDSWECVNSGKSENYLHNPSQRISHTAVWTGQKMVVWGGSCSVNPDPSTPAAQCMTTEGVSSAIAEGDLDTGGRFTSPGTWNRTTTNDANLPEPRAAHTAVWTGSEMIVWGGTDSNLATPARLNSGGRYTPASVDSWLTTSVGPNVPTKRAGHTAVWTGAEMIVWGGAGCEDAACSTGTNAYLGTGSRYSAIGDSWLVAAGGRYSPSPRASHTAVWTGTTDPTLCNNTNLCNNKMMVWGGVNTNGTLGTGSVYDPVAPFFTQQPIPYYEFSQLNGQECSADFSPYYFFSVAASDPSASYQWQKQVANVWIDISDGNTQPGNVANPATYGGTATQQLSINFPGCNESGNYRAVIRNGVCAAGAASDPLVFVPRVDSQGVKCCINY